MWYDIFMQEDEIKFLLDKDTVFAANGVSLEVLASLDEVILSFSQMITEDVYFVYKKFCQMKQEAPEGMKSELFTAIKNFIKEKMSAGEYPDALFLLRFLLVKSELSAQTYYDIAQTLAELGKSEFAGFFIANYEKKETNKPLKYLSLANFYNLTLKDYKTAIKYYEKYLKIDETKAVVYTILASLYSKAYGDISLNDQIFYFEKAYKLKPKDRLTLHGLAFAYERLGDKKSSDKFYRELLENNPTDTDYFNYGCFLISCGDFENGHKYFTHRFSTGDVNLEYPLPDVENKWDMKSDISDKILLVHYEQGFGDTFMYCRFVPELKKLAKKVVFVVQDSLAELIKSSPLISEGIEVVSDYENLAYDCHMALLDVPYAVGAKSDNLPLREGYLEVEQERIKNYAEKYIKQSGNLKVGIAYSGDKSANYNGRDIDVCRFGSLLKLDGIDFYSLQADCNENVEGLILLGSSFKDFTDTACAIKNMDLIITTDNVILNLAGALGVKTYGLFNFYPNFRWFSLTGENTVWYNSVTPLQVEENNRWSPLFAKLYNELSSMRAVAGK